MELGFLGASAGEESVCIGGDPGLIPVSGRSPGEGIGYPLENSWTSLVAQLVKNPPAMWEIWVQFLSREDPLEKGKATHSSILAWRILGHKESEMNDQLSLVCLKFIFMSIYLCICEQVKEE